MQIPQPDLGIMMMIGYGIEYAKIYLPDDIEPKVLPLVSLLIGAGLGYLQGTLLVGIVSGIAISAAYGYISKIADKVGGNNQII